ncbi:cytochrome b/b6 domain-containing protein [Hyphomonas sp.]|uniref:cytochrome b/b6 domain-containing protein n=1 Tax=Hyphomonas sp. TaxID=87 RepID=UPI003919D061
MSEARAERYSGVAIALHWAMAALLLFMIWLGWNMDDSEARYQLHKSIGITILFLTLARLGWRLMNPPPALPADINLWERRASHAVQFGFYALMLGIPLGGWLMVSVSPFQVSTVLFGFIDWPHLPFTAGLRSEDLYELVENMHSKGAWVILVLLGLHVAGAVKHEMGVEDGVLRRMVPGGGLPAQRSGNAARSAAIAFGGSALLFALIAGSAMLGPGRTAAAELASGGGGNWAVDYDASEIRFSGDNDGNAFSGTFRRWTADVMFDPDDLANASVTVNVDTGSAATGMRLYDSTLREAEWFNIAAHPQASVVLSDFEARGEDRYRATATLTLKGETASERLEFTLVMDGDEGILSGETSFRRRDLNLGMASDPDGKWVSDEIAIAISGRAKRLR